MMRCEKEATKRTRVCQLDRGEPQEFVQSENRLLSILGPSSRMTGGQAIPLTREMGGMSQGLRLSVPGDVGEHSEEEWYPPTPPIYDVTEKLRCHPPFLTLHSSNCNESMNDSTN